MLTAKLGLEFGAIPYPLIQAQLLFKKNFKQFKPTKIISRLSSVHISSTSQVTRFLRFFPVFNMKEHHSNNRMARDGPGWPGMAREGPGWPGMAEPCAWKLEPSTGVLCRSNSNDSMGIEASNGGRDLLSRRQLVGLWIATGCHGPHIDSKHQQTLP